MFWTRRQPNARELSPQERDTRAQSLERCIADHGAACWRMAYALIRDAHESHDAVQAACLVAVRKLDELPQPDPWPWFRTIVINEARNSRRRLLKARRPTTLTPEEGAVELPDTKGSEPDVPALTREESEGVWRALDQLDEREREVLLLTLHGGMTHAEASKALDRPVKTVSSQARRGMERLREKLGAKHTHLARGLPALGLADPVGGLSSAIQGWLGVTKATLATTTTVTATGAGIALAGTGGIAMASKAVIGITAACALALGAAGGFMAGNDSASDDAPASNTTGSVALTPAPKPAEPNPRLSELEGEVASLKQALVGISSERDSLKNQLSNAEAKARTLQASLDSAASSATSDELEAARREVAELKTELDRLKNPKPQEGSFASLYDMPEIQAADWKLLAKCAMSINTGAAEILARLKRGEQPTTEEYMALGEHNGPLVDFLKTVVNKLKTNLPESNGEFTHPIAVARMVEQILVDKGDPLSERQQSSLRTYGEAYVADYDAFERSYSDATPLLEKVRDEFTLKVRFGGQLESLLTPTQHATVYIKDVRGMYQFDALSPNLMLMTLPAVAVSGTTAEALGAEMRKRLKSMWKLDDRDMALADMAFERYMQDIGPMLLNAVDANWAYFFHENDSMIAIKAQTALQATLLSMDGIPEARRGSIREAHTLLVPRLIKISTPAGE